MSEMIERVARAIALAQLDNDTRAVVDPNTWPVAESYCDMARAAIEAMREPTDGQRNAYYELSHQTEIMMDAHWERAIDAALSEKS